MVQAFAQWMHENGWTMSPGVATRGEDLTGFHWETGTTLLVECKGDTGTKMGATVDGAYGQLLRRMDRGRAYNGMTDTESICFALVVPRTDKCVYAALRVSRRIRQLLRISVYSVGEDGSVVDESEDWTLAPT